MESREYEKEMRGIAIGSIAFTVGGLFAADSIITLKDYNEIKTNELKGVEIVKDYNVPPGFKLKDEYISLGLYGLFSLTGAFLVAYSCFRARQITNTAKKEQIKINLEKKLLEKNEKKC